MPNSTTLDVEAIKEQFEILQNMFSRYLPKVDPELIYDLLFRLYENPRVTPTYTLEVFTKAGVDSRDMIKYIREITGTMPTVYDNETHYVTNEKLTLEMLLEVSKFTDIVDIAGAPTTSGCWLSDSVKREEV